MFVLHPHLLLQSLISRPCCPPGLSGMTTFWRRVLGDGECDEEECGHGEEETVPGWTAATDALLQFWDLRVVIIIYGEKVRERTESG